MHGISCRGAIAAAVFFAIVPMTLLAQPAPAADERIERLEEQIELLQKQLDELRLQLDELRGTPAEDAVSGAEPAPADDLMAVAPVAAPSAPQAAEPLGAPVTSAPSTTTSRSFFNPQISVVGNLLGHAGDENPFDERDSFAFDEAEIALESFVDPYAKAKIFIGVGEDEVELEEGFIHFLTLPAGLQARAGKLKSSFGKFNLQHSHTWSWADAPLVSRTFFGDEGLADAGLSVSGILPNPFGLYLEGTAEVFRGTVEEVFEPQSRNDLLWVGHLRGYRDLTEASNVEVGGSFATGGLEDGGRSRFSGLDLTYRWKPLERSLYRSLLARAEVMRNDRDDVESAALGYYASGDFQFARRWMAGLRLDRVERPEDPSLTDRGGALTLTFRPSEFSLIRGQVRQTEYAEDFDALELLFQIQFSIGAHGAHVF